MTGFVPAKGTNSGDFICSDLNQQRKDCKLSTLPLFYPMIQSYRNKEGI